MDIMSSGDLISGQLGLRTYLATTVTVKAVAKAEVSQEELETKDPVDSEEEQDEQDD